MVAPVIDRIYGQSSGVAVKAPCLWVSVAPNALSGLAGVTGATPAEGDRVLVLGNTDPITNGIYNASALAWKRAGDCDGAYDVVQGTLIVVYYPGTASLIYQLTTANPVIGTTPLTFQSFANLNPNAYFPPPTPAEIGAGVTVVAQQYLPGELARYGANSLPGMSSMDAALAAAIAQGLQAGGAAVTISQAYALANSATIPSGVSVEAKTGGSFVIAATKTLTMNGQFRAPRSTVFTGAGVVIFGSGSALEAYPEWWGARPDSKPGVNGTISVTGTDCTAAIAACLLACAGGAGLKIGLVPIRLSAGTYLTGNQLVPPATIMRGMGREQGGFLAKAGTVGDWFNDTGSAAKHIIEDIAWYGAYAASPGMVNTVKFGYNATQAGTEGYYRNLWIRDGACSGGGYQFDVSQDVCFFDQISIYSNGMANQSCCRISGAGAQMSKFVIVAPGSGGYGLNLSSISNVVNGLEIEAPQSGSIPLMLGGNTIIDGVSFSHGNYAAVGALDAWVVFGANCSTWKLTGVNYLSSSPGANSGTDTVTSGNFKRADGSYFGGNSTTNTVYNAGTTYNQGNVTNSAGTSYIYINVTPTAGNAPPNATYWAVTTLPYGHGGEGNYDSNNNGQSEQSFTFRLVNTAGTLQHKFSEPGGAAISSQLVGCINAATSALTNTPTATDATTAFAAGAKISSVSANVIILDSPVWPALTSESGAVHTQRVADFDASVAITFNSTSTALNCIASVQSVNVNGVAANRWSFSFYDNTGAAFALTTGNIAAGKILQVGCRIAMAR